MNEERLEEYLWDPSREADPEVEHLERSLSRWRYGARQEDREQIEAELAGLLNPRRSKWPRFLWPLPFLLAAASLVLFLRAPWGGPAYRVRGVDGMPHARVGDHIRVGEQPARMTIGDIGEVLLEPGSRLVVQEIRRGKDELHALFMEFGAMHARIDSKPRVFQVGTPAGISIDLGCEYRLEVEADDRCRIQVLTGQISFGYEGREVYVPAGASCQSIPGRGPSPPLFDTTGDELRGLVQRAFEGGQLSQEQIDRLLGIDERQDALPLFALMTDEFVDAGLRSALFDFFTLRFETPPAVTRAGILAGDEGQRRAWLQAVQHWWY